MPNDNLQLLLARKNIARLIKRINILEDRIEILDKIRYKRPDYHIENIEDNWLPIA